MKFLDWIFRDAQPIALGGDSRLARGFREYQRGLEGLPPQHKACLVDKDGKRSHYVLDLQHNGTPRNPVFVSCYTGVTGKPGRKRYSFLRIEGGHLVYKEF